MSNLGSDAVLEGGVIDGSGRYTVAVLAFTKNLAISISLEAAELLENFQWQVGEEPITPEIKKRASK